MDAQAEAGITAFELARNKRIEDNLRRMRDLGIFKLAPLVV